MGAKYSNKDQKKYKSTVEEPMAVYDAGISNAFAAQDRYGLIKKSKEGVSTDVFYRFATRTNLAEKQLASFINMSPRTVSNYRDHEKTMDAHYGEHLLKLIGLFEAGKEYLGSYEEFKNWLERPFWGSEERTKDFLNTSTGVDLVMERLERMAQGYPL